MRFERMVSGDEPLYKSSDELYKANFIYEERRDDKEQKRVMQDKRYFCCAVIDEETDSPVGIVYYWVGDDFIYLEHLCVDNELRGKSYGSKILGMLKSLGKRVILEIEPVVDENTARRRHFYENNGFILNSHRHIQPKYHLGDDDLELWVMSENGALTEKEYESFNGFLQKYVRFNGDGYGK